MSRQKDLVRTKSRLHDQAVDQGLDELYPEGSKNGKGSADEEDIPDEMDTTTEIVSRDETGEPELIKAPLLFHPTRDDQVKIKVFTARDQYKYQIRQAEFKEQVEEGDYERFGEVIADADQEPVGMYLEEDQGDTYLPFDLVADVITKHLKEPNYGRVTKEKLLGWNNNLVQAYWMTITVFGAGVDLSEDSESKSLGKKK